MCSIVAMHYIIQNLHGTKICIGSYIQRSYIAIVHYNYNFVTLKLSFHMYSQASYSSYFWGGLQMAPSPLD